MAEGAAKATHFARRYTPNQHKALERLHHSKRVFNYSTKLEDDEILLRIFEGNDDDSKKIPNLVRINNAFDAAREGELAKLKRFVERHGFDARSHDDANGGNTILHYAAWLGDLDSVRYIIHHVRSTFGDKEVVSFVNRIDTVSHRSTAVMEACRSNVGTVSDRLECIRELIHAGADTTSQDIRGDTCLHIAVRHSFLPIVRLLCQETTTSLLATTVYNGRMQKPVQLAKVKCGLAVTSTDNPPPSVPYAKSEILRLLRKAEREGRCRLKLALLSRRRRERARRLQAENNKDRIELKKNISDISHRSWAAWGSQRVQANDLRKQERDMVREAAKKKLPEHFATWISTDEAQLRLLKLQQSGHSEEEAKEIIKEEHHRERIYNVEQYFLSQNPTCPEWEEYLEQSKGGN